MEIEQSTHHGHHEENLQGGNPSNGTRGVLPERAGFVVLLEDSDTYCLRS